MAFEDVLDWSKKQPEWAQDALRRVLGASGHKLSETEQTEVLLRVKHANGIAATPAPACTALTAEHLPKEAVTGAHRTILCSITDVKNVNQLVSDQVLSFATDGITLIYGDNGSGKSGYSRVAKKLCRSIAPENILGNVFAEGGMEKAEAKARYQLTPYSSVSETHWIDGNKPPEPLAHISVFDTENARLYVDEHNKIQYLPPPISLMESYANLFRVLAGKVEAEITTVKSRTSTALPAGYHEGSSILLLLGPMTNPALRKGSRAQPLPTEKEIRTAAAWDEKQEKVLEDLEKNLKDDPAILAEKCRRISTTLTSLSADAKAIESALSVDILKDLKSKAANAKTTKEAAALAASQLFKKEPIPHTGSDKWRAMYDYARAFAEQASGQKSQYPSVNEHCVLCQQGISTEAAERLKKFDEFIEDKANVEASTASDALNAARNAISSLKTPTASDVTQALGEYSGLNEETKAIASQIIDFFEAAKKRRDDMITALIKDDFSAVGAMPENISSIIDGQATVYKDRAATHKKEADAGGDRIEDKKKLAELKDKKKLSQDLEVFVARLKDFVLIEALTKCSDALNTTGISKCITSLRKKLVTEDMEKRVQAEISNFDLGHIPFDVSDKSRGGDSLMAVELRSVADVDNKEVLSEGEQRALALACFLSEAIGNPIKHGIIIDDPVSSLDHLRIQKVAKRLVDEAAAGRQVIVFTHNLIFYSEVHNLAAEAQVPVKRHCIRKDTAKGFGIIHADDEPWIAKEVSKRAHILRNERLPNFKGRSDTDTEDYRRAVKSFYSELRETWERLVEELLLGGVISRFNSDVKTQSLKRVVVEDEDYRKIYFAMKRVSAHSGHDMAQGRTLSMPTYDDMQKELDELDAMRTEIKRRADKKQDERKELEKPPRATEAA